MPTNESFERNFRSYNPKSCRVRFKCALKQQQCKGYTHRGKVRCKRMVNFHLPYCQDHLASISHLSVDCSSLGNFKGLFAHNPVKKPGEVVFSKGDVIAPYIAERISSKKADRRYGKNGTGRYAWADPDQKKRSGRSRYVVHDAACKRGAASYSNSPKGSGKRSNAIIRLTSKSPKARPHLVATKTIRNGDEILTNYGKGYWEGVQDEEKCDTRFSNTLSCSDRRVRRGVRYGLNWNQLKPFKRSPRS